MALELLETERTYLKRNAKRFRKKYRGKFLLIQGEEVLGAYPSHDEAVSAGVSRFPPDVPFLVRPADNPEDPVLDNIALSHGIPISCPSSIWT